MDDGPVTVQVVSGTLASGSAVSALAAGKATQALTIANPDTAAALSFGFANNITLNSAGTLTLAAGTNFTFPQDMIPVGPLYVVGTSTKPYTVWYR